MNISRFLPLWEDKTVRTYYFVNALLDFWLIEVVGTFYMIQFMSFTTIETISMFGVILIIILEIPSGALADLIGRKKTVVFGLLLLALLRMFQGSAQSEIYFWIASIFGATGEAFYSGAMNALLYDHLKNTNKEKIYEEVNSAAVSFQIYLYVFAVGLGYVLYSINNRLPFFVWMALMFIGAFFVFKLKEEKYEKTTFSYKNYIKQLSMGFKELLAPPIGKYILLFFNISGFYYFFDYSILKATTLREMGFNELPQTIYNIIFSIVGGVLIKYTPKLRNFFGDKKGFFVLSFVVGISFIGNAFVMNYWGIIPVSTLLLSGYFAYIWINAFINEHTDSKNRATTLSTYSILEKMPMLLLSIVFGLMADLGRLNFLHFGIGLFIITVSFIIFVIFLAHKKRLKKMGG